MKEFLFQEWEVNLAKNFLAMMANGMFVAAKNMNLPLPDDAYGDAKKYVLPVYFIAVMSKMELNPEQVAQLEVEVEAWAETPPKAYINFKEDGTLDLRLAKASYKGSWTGKGDMITGDFSMQTAVHPYENIPAGFKLSADGKQLEGAPIPQLQLAVPLEITQPLRLPFVVRVTTLNKQRATIVVRYEKEGVEGWLEVVLNSVNSKTEPA